MKDCDYLNHVLQWYRRAKAQPDVPTAYVISNVVDGGLRSVYVRVEDMDAQPNDVARIALIEAKAATLAAVHRITCLNCGQEIAADRYELHRLLCKPQQPEGVSACKKRGR